MRYNPSDREKSFSSFSWASLVMGLFLGGIVGAGLVYQHMSAQQKHLLEQQKTTLQTDFLSATEALQAQMSQCAKDRQTHLAERLALVEALGACQKKQAEASPSRAPKESVAGEGAVKQADPQTPVLDKLSGASSVKTVHVLQPKPRPQMKSKKLGQMGAVAPLASSSPPLLTSDDDAQSQPQKTALPPRAQSKTITLSVGQEVTLPQGGVLSLSAVSRLKNGKFCVVLGPHDEAVRISSGSGKVLVLGGARYTLVATVKDSQSCVFSLQ